MRITDPAQIQRYYQALLDRSPEYIGTFYVGVRTTSVFCIATCRARKPKAENVEFFSDFKDALDAGYRPCKICRPTEHAHDMPPPVASAMALLRANPKEKIGDARLRADGIGPEAVRRWFLKHYGMTFQAYQRMTRINQAMEELKTGKRSIDTALDHGYQSLSGFGYTYRKLIGGSPSAAGRDTVILISRLTTPIGPMFICATEQGVCLLEFVDRRMLETEFEDLQRRLRARIIAGENEAIRQARRELDEYFAGTRPTFSVPLDTPGSDFQRTVWQALQSIPCGQTASYKQQAERIGRPQAVRAVAAANGANRVSILIPCHRVIGSNGDLTGYGGGLARKQWLLAHEASLARHTDSCDDSR
ncbi:bifunctional transcriptional activator/DNA repair enzyme AdaA [Paludibacterium purpuratum]|uniref:Methylated-DNA--protein-cysteine methyltransferase n=1 Tax=Paludibacterium purpuratum TaxID=1144873 RepID=A0A4R7AW11_9NEIS|nr:bifunctional transcriptional activator/DNA repair protein Ada [Paludibacterium purpuratum]TDR71455.1 AraC family transcriptional regulator of adaptative response/methylated-DNA-[protein]-cysteine methyltransferase [Paludibacterium purpuratum]